MVVELNINKVNMPSLMLQIISDFFSVNQNPSLALTFTKCFQHLNTAMENISHAFVSVLCLYSFEWICGKTNEKKLSQMLLVWAFFHFKHQHFVITLPENIIRSKGSFFANDVSVANYRLHFVPVYSKACLSFQDGCASPSNQLL